MNNKIIGGIYVVGYNFPRFFCELDLIAICSFKIIHTNVLNRVAFFFVIDQGALRIHVVFIFLQFLRRDGLWFKMPLPGIKIISCRWSINGVARQSSESNSLS